MEFSILSIFFLYQLLPTRKTTNQDSVVSKVKFHQERHELSLVIELFTEDWRYLSKMASFTQSRFCG